MVIWNTSSLQVKSILPSPLNNNKLDIIFCKSQEMSVLGLLLTTSFNNEREQDILAAFCLHFENGFVLGTKSLAQTKLGVLDQKE